VHGIDVFEALAPVDGGNVMFPMFQPSIVREAIEAEVGAVIAAGAVPFVVGGDHSVALPVMRALFRAHGPLAVVHVDAHLDTSGPETWMEPFHHGTPFRHAIAEGLVARGKLHQIGIRGPWGSGEDAAVSLSHGGKIHGADVIERRGLASVLEAVRRDLDGVPVYVSFDIDAVDPAFAPGTGTPVPGGLTSREALSLLRALAGVRLVGMDLVEVCPALDHADLTAHLAAHLLFEGLALAALSRRAGARR
jgi:agmatinase